ncbi:hypothetical protein Tco_0531078 [Tanacetum coccineum]
MIHITLPHNSRLLGSKYGNVHAQTDRIGAMHDFLKILLKDLQIHNEIQPLKQETPNQIQKDQEEKSIAELLAEERLQKANQALNENKSPQEIRIQDLEIQKQQFEARARIHKSIIDDDDDDLGFYAVHPNTIHTPVSQNVEPKDSLIMGDGHINTTPETEMISVETLVSNPSESDDFSLGELAHLAPISPEIVEVCVDDDDTDDDDDYDDDFYDCVDIEEDGGEIDLDISKIVDTSLREKLVESYLLIEKINAFSLSPPIPISPIFCPSSTIPVVDLDLSLEEADVPSFSDDSILRGIESDRDSGEDTTSIDDVPLDDSIILPKYESFTFDDEPVMAEVNVFDEINTSELSYPGIGENVVLDEEEDTFTFTTRSFLPFVTYPEVLPTFYSTGSEDKVFNPGICDNLLTRKSSLTLDVFDPLHPPLMDFHGFPVLEDSLDPNLWKDKSNAQQFPLMVSTLLFIKVGNLLILSVLSASCSFVRRSLVEQDLVEHLKAMCSVTRGCDLLVVRLETCCMLLIESTYSICLRECFSTLQCRCVIAGGKMRNLMRIALQSACGVDSAAFLTQFLCGVCWDGRCEPLTPGAVLLV